MTVRLLVATMLAVAAAVPPPPQLVALHGAVRVLVQALERALCRGLHFGCVDLAVAVGIHLGDLAVFAGAIFARAAPAGALAQLFTRQLAVGVRVGASEPALGHLALIAADAAVFVFVLAGEQLVQVLGAAGLHAGFDLRAGGHAIFVAVDLAQPGLLGLHDLGQRHLAVFVGVEVAHAASATLAVVAIGPCQRGASQSETRTENERGQREFVHDVFLVPLRRLRAVVL